MKKAFAAFILTLAAVLTAVPSAEASPGNSGTPGCHVLSVETRTETAFGHTRTVTTTVTKCRGQITTAYAYSPWHLTRHTGHWVVCPRPVPGHYLCRQA